jgi:thioredoxin-like negative regulator of GroEL
LSRRGSDQALRRKLGNRFPDRRPGNAEARREISLVQRIAGKQFAAVDLIFKLLPDFIGKIQSGVRSHITTFFDIPNTVIWYTLKSFWYFSLPGFMLFPFPQGVQ